MTTMTDACEGWYVEGGDAFNEKVLLEANPYEPDTHASGWWTRGWKRSQRLAERRAEDVLHGIPAFTEERRAMVNAKALRGGEIPCLSDQTPEELAHHVEAMVCSFLGWPGNQCSDAELVYTIALGALRRMQELAK